MSASNEQWNGVERRTGVRLRLLMDTLYDRIADLERQVALQNERLDAMERRGMRSGAVARGRVKNRIMRTQGI